MRVWTVDVTPLLEALAATPTDPLPDLGLRSYIMDTTAGLEWPGGGLYLNKTRINSLLGCGGLHLARQNQPFAWTTASARGQIAHHAIRLSRGLRPDPPTVIAARAYQHLAGRADQLADFLDGLDAEDRVELQEDAAALVCAWHDLGHGIADEWHPVTEFALRAELGPLTVSGRVDLHFGRPAPKNGAKKRTAIHVEIKTGRRWRDGLADLDLYALLECLRTGQPPRAGALVALDSGEWHVLQPDEARLVAAADRLAAAAETACVLARGVEPRLIPGPACSYCPNRHTCPENPR